MLSSLLRTYSTTAAIILICAFLSPSPALAQIDYDTGNDTVFAHSETLPWWLSAQGNFIFQWHPSFHADYSGPNSFEHASEQAASEVTTLYGESSCRRRLKPSRMSKAPAAAG